MVFDWEKVIGPSFLKEESHGVMGCEIPTNLCNLFIQPQKILLTEEHLRLEFDQFCPEGLGWSQYNSGTLQIPQDRILNRGLVLLWDAQVALPPMQQFCWIYDVEEVFPSDEFHFTFQTTSNWLPLKNRSHQGIHHLELFAGGFGGWSMASQWLQSSYGIDIQTVAVETDPHIAAAYAITHSAVLLRSTKTLPTSFLQGANRNVILMTDVLSEDWHHIVANWTVDCVTISSPCKPFSGASSSKGLLTQDGMLLPRTLLAIRRFRPVVIMIEQVHKFAAHSHKVWVVKLLHAIGYHIVWQKTLDLQTHMPTHRPRWLAIAVRIHGNWPKIPMHNWGPSTFTCLRNYDCIMHFSEQIIKQLEITDAIRQVASNPRFSKMHMSRRQQQADGIFRTRLATIDMPSATFMALYGSQHKLNEDRLAEFGFFGHYFHHQGVTRHYHPIEVALIHGVMQSCYLYDDLEISWLILGNQISVLQALFPWVLCLHGLVNFEVGWNDILSKYHDERLKASKLQVSPLTKGYVIHQKGFTVEHQDTSAEKELMDWILIPEYQPSAWVPGLGIVSFDDLIAQFQATHDLEPSREASAISIPTTQEHLTPTLHFVPVVQHGVVFLEGTSKFWATSDLPMHEMAQLWQGTAFVQTDCLLGSTVSITAGICDDAPADTILGHIVVVLTSNKLMLLPRDHLDLTTNVTLKSIGLPLFDLIGQPLSSTIEHPHNAIVDSLFLGQKHEITPEFVLAAHQSIALEVKKDSSRDCLSISLHGNPESILVAQLFWSKVLDEPSCDAINRSLRIIKTSDDFVDIAFVGQQTHAALPVHNTCFLLSVMATKALLGMLSHESGIPIALKFQGEIIWVGSLPPDISIQLILSLLQISLFPTQRGVLLRAVHQGKCCPGDTCLSQLHISSHRRAAIIHLVGALQGGGGTKQQQRTLHKNALASVLIEQGFDVKWTSQAVDVLLQAGLQKIEPITSMGPGQTRIHAVLNLCREQGIELPKPEVPKSQKTIPRPLGKKIKKSEQLLDPNEFQLVPGFFSNQDDSEVTQLTSLRPHTCGIVILTPPQVESWLREGTSITSDELGALVLGPLPSNTALPNQKVTFPCKNAANQDVLLTATLVQFGARAIKVAQGKADQVKEQACALIALTAFKDNFDAATWEQCVTGTYAFFKTKLAEEGLSNCIQTSWGKSLRNQKAAATPNQATSVQIHCTVPITFVPQLLAQSGFNGIFATPKDRTGRLDSAYKVIWCEGDLPKITSLSQKTDNCMGLIRGKNSLGLRFRGEHFADAWKAIYPDTTPPERVGTDKLFKVLGLPFGCSGEMIAQWCTAIGWNARAIKGLGPQCWLLGASAEPPPGIQMFNTTPVLIQNIQARAAATAPVLVGPRGLKQQQIGIASPTPDPWAQWTGPRLTPTPGVSSVPASDRATHGPIEQKFTAQESRIAKLENDLVKLSESQKQFQDSTHQQFVDIQKRDKQNMTEVRQSMKSLKGELEQSFQEALTVNASSVDKSMQELKDLFRQHFTAKRKSGDQDQDMES